jgi:hypothetical protein
MAEYTIGKDVDLKAEQQRTLNAPMLPPGFVLRGMFVTFDMLYGKACTLAKVKVLEVLARYPYWAWENSAYYQLTRLYATGQKVDSAKVERLLELIELGRESQDNEQCHLLLIDDILHQKGIRLNWFSFAFLPLLLTFIYHYLARLIFFIQPRWSFYMNAAFESHAEHEYMKMAAEHPEWDEEEIDSVFFKYYPKQKTLADLVRRIGLDERDHMNHSLEQVEKLRAKKNL